MRFTTTLTVFFIFACLTLARAEGVCTYSVDTAKGTLQWTGFKTTKKVGVKGSFTKFEVKGAAEGKTLADVLKGLEVTIDASSVQSGDPARDKNLADFFFKKMLSDAKIKGHITAVTGDDKGTLTLQVAMNGVTKDLPLTFETTPEGLWQAKGTLDLMDFNGSAALASLNTVCKEKHTGEDGVLKTWSDVEISLSAPIRKECH